MCVSASWSWPDIGPLLGGQIHNQLDRDVMPALDNVLRMAAGKVKTHTHTLYRRGHTPVHTQTWADLKRRIVAVVTEKNPSFNNNLVFRWPIKIGKTPRDVFHLKILTRNIYLSGKMSYITKIHDDETYMGAYKSRHVLAYTHMTWT